jgi:hypothetical protein
MTKEAARNAKAKSITGAAKPQWRLDPPAGDQIVGHGREIVRRDLEKGQKDS